LAEATKEGAYGAVSIVHDPNPPEIGSNLLQQLHPLAANRKIPNDKPGDVAAGVSEALHQPEADRIGDQGENDRNGVRSLAQGLSGGKPVA
jgi:hypothetical protein